MKKYIPALLVAICTTTALGRTAEELLNRYDPVLAEKTYELIENFKEKQDTSPEAMTEVARTIFLMYGLNPDDITASYGGTESKAVYDTGNGKVRICVAERRDPDLEHYAKAYGNDTFLHEMLHALAYKWSETGSLKKRPGHSNKTEKEHFEKCRQILVDAIWGIKEKAELFRQKFDDLMKNDKFPGDEEQLEQYIIKRYIKYRGDTTKLYSRAKRLHPLLAIQYIHGLGLPLDAEYVYGHIDGKKMWVVKVYVGSNIKKYKPDTVDLYYDDVNRAINEQIKHIQEELKAVKKGKIPKDKMTDFLNNVRYEKFKERYWYDFTKNQDIEMELPKL